MAPPYLLARAGTPAQRRVLQPFPHRMPAPQRARQPEDRRPVRRSPHRAPVGPAMPRPWASQAPLRAPRPPRRSAPGRFPTPRLGRLPPFARMGSPAAGLGALQRRGRPPPPVPDGRRWVRWRRQARRAVPHGPAPRRRIPLRPAARRPMLPQGLAPRRRGRGLQSHPWPARLSCQGRGVVPRRRSRRGVAQPAAAVVATAGPAWAMPWGGRTCRRRCAFCRLGAVLARSRCPCGLARGLRRGAGPARRAPCPCSVP